MVNYNTIMDNSNKNKIMKPKIVQDKVDQELLERVDKLEIGVEKERRRLNLNLILAVVTLGVIDLLTMMAIGILTGWR